MSTTYLTNALLEEQFRFPRTKKRRIRNKWAKRPENIRRRRVIMSLPPSVVRHIQSKFSPRAELPRTVSDEEYRSICGVTYPQIG